VSVLAGQGSTQPVTEGYDPNIDIVMASVYGAVPCTDTKLLATAAQLRRQWADSASPAVYPINLSDASLGVGPVLGRYPGDTYDGDVAHPVLGGHPWALCTANFAELYYRLAAEIARTKKVPFDDLSAEFFGQVGIQTGTTAKQAVASLTQAGDAMLQAVVYHSDNLELSEQFDGTTGYEKSVRDLTWSYAAFISAVRARGEIR
jgi:glucoamylase